MDEVPRIEGLEGAVLVGRGGFGEVYRAEQPAFGRPVAVKLLRRALPGDARTRFDQERAALGALSGHPNVVTVYDAGLVDDGRPYLVMEYLAGGSFGASVAAGRPLGWEEVARIGIKLAGALETAHRAGILHCDVKPENVMLSAYGEPKLADFGVAELASTEGSGPVHASVSHAAPEVLAGGRCSVAADVYALGSTLAALAGGHPVFRPRAGESHGALVARILTEPAVVDTPAVPPSLRRALETAMAKAPVDRQETAAVFGGELQTVLREAGMEPTPVPLGSQPAPGMAASGEDTRGAPWRPAASAISDGSRRTSGRWVILLVAAAIVLVSVLGAIVLTTRRGSGVGQLASQTPVVPSVTGTAVTAPTSSVTAPTTTPAATGSGGATTTVSSGPAPCLDVLTYGQVTQCPIETPGQTRRHTFQGAKGDRVLVDAAQIEGNLLPGVAVLRPDGSDACPNLRACVLDTAGQHTVLVADTFGTISGKNTGQYSLYIQRLNDPVGCRPLVYGTPAQGTVSRPGTQDCLTFAGSTGDRLFITDVTLGGDLVAGVDVFRPDGTEACPNLSECILDTTGRQTVIVGDTNGVTTGNRTGTYRLNITCTAGPCR